MTCFRHVILELIFTCLFFIAQVESTSAFVEDNTCGKPKKGKKYDFEEVCYKSNWFKKKQAKKDEKLSGNKFLKNGWAR